jgi:hypothetical protein
MESQFWRSQPMAGWPIDLGLGYHGGTMWWKSLLETGREQGLRTIYTHPGHAPSDLTSSQQVPPIKAPLPPNSLLSCESIHLSFQATPPMASLPPGRPRLLMAPPPPNSPTAHWVVNPSISPSRPRPQQPHFFRLGPAS